MIYTQTLAETMKETYFVQIFNTKLGVGLVHKFALYMGR